MQSTHRLLSVLLLLALLLTLAAPATAQRPGPAAQPLGVAPAGQAKEEACAALSAQEQAELAQLAERKAAGALAGADYERFLKLSDRTDCAAKAAAPAAISAVSTYSFSQFGGTYTPITGGTVHGTGTSVDDNNYNAVNIGFTFNYDGVAYTQVSINANGFVRFGGTAFTDSCSYTPISSSSTSCKNLVSALGMDLQGNTGGELRSETLGAAPNRVFVVQWTDFRFYNVTGDSFNFQIRLYETTDVVEFVYGSFTKNSTSRSPQVGLKGATNADYNNRTGTNWAASTAGTSNSATMTLSTSSLPASGQTYQWTPPVPNDVGVTAITAPVSSCFLGNAESVTVTIKNFGTATQTSIPVEYQVNGGGWITETWTGSLAPGATVNYTFSATADLSAAGTYIIDARTALVGDGNPGNDQTSKTVVKPSTVNTFPYFEGFESGPAGWTSGGTNSSWQLGTPNDTVIIGAYEGTNAWTTGLTTDYNASEQSYVLSGCFDFTGLTNPKIDLAVWWNSEFSYDGANLQYTLDGTTWTTVGAKGDPNNWYNDDTISGLAWSGSQHGWTGRTSSGNGSGGWLVASHGLAALAGQPAVQFRVAFGADGSVQDDGFAFDAVNIYDDAVPPGCAINPSPADGATEVWWDADLTWAAGPGGTPTSYDVYFGTSPTPPFVVNQSGTTYDPGTMPYGTTYYWQIVPKNSYGSATGCPVWSFTTFAPVTPGFYSQHFDGTVTGWTVENTNGDAYTWGVQTTYRRGTSGAAAGVRWNSAQAMDDWLFTPPLQLTGGVTYAVRFFYRAASASYPERMEVKWGNANSSAAMTNGPIFDDPNINFTTMKEAIATFTPATSGIYFVGFHGYSAADKFWLILDDVTVYDASDPVWEWQGGVDDDWFKNANWEGGIVPGELDQVKIPAAPTNQPTVGTSSEPSYGRVQDLTVDPNATLTLAAAHNLKVNGTLTNNGTLQQTLNVPLATPTMFLNVKSVGGTDKYFGAEINATVSALGDTTVKVHGNQQCPLASPSMIGRCYDVTPTTVGPADIKFYFTEPEFTPYNHPLPALQVFNYHSGTWNLQTRGTDSGTCNPGAINCFVEGTNISAYSPFGMTEAGPNALRLGSTSAEAAPVPWPAAALLAAAVAAVLAVARRRRTAA